MKKKFYIFLCVVLGVALMLIIQRGLLAVYIILIDTYLTYDLLTGPQITIINWGSAFVAIIVGLLYGNFLGHHWYPLVYDDKGARAGKSVRGGNSASMPAPQQKTVTVKPVRAAAAQVSFRSETRDEGWDFDDLISHDLPAVESLSNAGPAVATAVSLGEKAPDKPAKKVVVKKPKAAAKPKTAKKPAKKSAKPGAKA